MKAFHTNTWKHRIAFGVVTIAIASGALELVAGSMKFPAPEAVAHRQQVLAAQSERAYQLRTLEAGEMKVASTTVAAAH